MMKLRSTTHICFSCRILAFLLLLLHLFVPSSGLNSDGVLLLSFKYSVLSDPLAVFADWNYNDETPCLWKGVACAWFPSTGPVTAPAADGGASRVVSLVLPKSQLLGSIPPDLFLIQHLQALDLSKNFLNGSIPATLFNASDLKSLSLSNNVISGSLPEFRAGQLNRLELLDLSDNALTGTIPLNISSLPNLKTLYLNNNYFSGGIPAGFASAEVLDLSSNLLNGSLPSDFAGDGLHFLNLSYNRISGGIAAEFASRIPANATIDLSFNNLTGRVPESDAFKPKSLAGNPDLCGKPFKNPCLIHSTLSSPPNISTSPPAIAAIPKTIDSSPVTGSSGNSTQQQEEDEGKMRPEAIVGIIVGDLAGIGILSLIFAYVYQLKKKRRKISSNEDKREEKGRKNDYNNNSSSNNNEGNDNSSDEVKGILPWLFCLRRNGKSDEEASETTSSDDSEGGGGQGEEGEEESKEEEEQRKNKKAGSLVTVDGETELEMETLLKASAYILGASGSSIVYKAVLEDGTTFAVRRIGESGVERIRDFANHIRQIAKLKHPNLVRVRGYYWAADEKLVIYDYVSNGSLANACYKRAGSSPYQLPWEVRLRIARGVARGLTYIHEKKHVHGNLKPSNILLGSDMEPKIGDFGLDRLVWGESSYKFGGSARYFGSKRSTLSRESLPELPIGASPSTSAATPCSGSGATPYHAPESLKNLKPSPRWDVYSFGVVLLELLTGKIFTDKELGQWSAGFVVEERNRILRMADVAIRADVEGKEEVLLSCFKLGISCASLVPQKRPSMKEALQVLEKLPSHPSSYDDHR